VFLIAHHFSFHRPISFLFTPAYIFEVAAGFSLRLKTRAKARAYHFFFEQSFTGVIFPSPLLVYLLRLIFLEQNIYRSYFPFASAKGK
jgi:hypothetical protein